MVVELVTGQFSRWNKKISGKIFGDFGFLSANTRLGGLVFSGTWCRGLFFTVGGWSHGSAGRPAWSLPGGEYALWNKPDPCSKGNKEIRLGDGVRSSVLDLSISNPSAACRDFLSAKAEVFTSGHRISRHPRGAARGCVRAS